MKILVALAGTGFKFLFASNIQVGLLHYQRSNFYDIFIGKFHLLFSFAAILAVHPPAAGLFRLAGGFHVSEHVATDECRGAADGEEN
jgi:hypothetical protein